MARLAEIRIGDIRRALGRYKPIAFTVAAILAIVLVTDAPPAGTGRFPGAFRGAPAAGVGDQIGGGFSPAGEDQPGDASLAAPSPAVGGLGGPGAFGGAGAFDSGFEPGGGFDGESSAGTSFDSGSFAGPSGSSDGFGSSGDFGSPDGGAPTLRPLEVVATAWASQGGGTAVGAVAVPEGSLPVAMRVGRLDKASFIRLTGEESTLVLDENPEGNRQLVGAAAVQACRIRTAGWAEGPNQDLADAPEWFADTCVEGVRDADGRWSFALGDLGDPADPRGFALVPAPDAPADFQLTFVDPTA